MSDLEKLKQAAKRKLPEKPKPKSIGDIAQNKPVEQKAVRRSTKKHTWTLEQFQMAYLLICGRLVDDFKINHPSINYHKELTRYFYGSSKIFDSKKGIFVTGTPGLSKTFSMTAIAELFNHYYRGYSQKMVEASCLTIATSLKTINDLRKYHSSKIIYIYDDIGQENESYNIFGSNYPIMEIITSEREKQFFKTGIKTHFTSNLTIKQILEKYGPRVYSRINKMCHIVSVEGSDIRLI